MEREIKIKIEAKYNGHNIKANSSVDLKLKCSYTQLVPSVETLQMLNNDIEVYVKLPEQGKPKRIGMFRLKENKIMDDGESALWLNSQTDFVELDNINLLVCSDNLKYMFKAKIELEGETGQEDEI